jgi:carboxypeptidase C (cathepsin A)
MEKSDKPKLAMQPEVFVPGRYESEGSVTLESGKTVPFKTLCEDNVFYNEEGKAIGSMFTYSYFRSDVECAANRPVVFFFNGGPGSGSLWLHVGLFGPWRVRYDDPEAVNVPSVPPYRVENNELCLIDIADLVFIDPVGTGWGRLLDSESSDQFYGMDSDADSFNTLIQIWLSTHDRWQSPKYLLGESYGTNRAALLAESLSGSSQGEFSCVGINGLVLLGNAIGQADDVLKFNTVEDAVLMLPSLAATTWYHNKIEGKLEDFVKKAQEFSSTEYLTALFQGASLPEDKRNEIAEKVAYFSGLKVETVLEQDLKPDKWEYLKLVLKDKGLEVGVYDSRFTLPLNKDYTLENMVRDDAAITQYTPSFMAAISGHYKKALGITHNRKYYAISREVNKGWKRESKRSCAKSLAASMRRNPELKVLFSSGMYDIQCQMGQAWYLANQINLDMSRVKFSEYTSGHMAYLGEPAAKAFADDVRAMIEGE